MKYIIYIRVSTENQGEHGLGAEAQLHACNEWIDKNRNKSEVLDTRIYKDVTTGTDRHKKLLAGRPKLMEALSEISNGDVLLTLKRDRIARDRLVIGLIEHELAKKKARLICANGDGDGDSPSDDALRGMLDVFAQYEGAIIRERIKMAMERKKARGERMGHIPYGYMLDANKNVIINPDEAKVLETMYNYRMISKMNFRDIATKLNEQGYRNRPNKNSNGSLWTYGATSRVYKNYPTLSKSSTTGS
jgi:DNA invertase Pin-like site-specific DNA recombinase